jgi:hypothetical protein
LPAPGVFGGRYAHRVVRAGVTAAAALALLLAGSLDATLTPNVRGTVPTGGGDTGSVKCFPDEPCDPPLGMMVTSVMFSRPGHATVRVRAVGGSFALHLVPGTYRIALQPSLGAVSPATVRVPRTGTVRLHLVVQPNP